MYKHLMLGFEDRETHGRGVQLFFDFHYTDVCTFEKVAFQSDAVYSKTDSLHWLLLVGAAKRTLPHTFS
jgi:hypothetical protein